MPRLECDAELTEAKEPGPRLPGPQTVSLGTHTEANKLIMAQLSMDCCRKTQQIPRDWEQRSARSPRGARELTRRLSPDKVSYPVLICSLSFNRGILSLLTNS